MAQNSYGKSEISPVGNGAIIVTVPNPPINLSNNPSVTTATQIGINWQDGIFNGGKPVTDYRISFDKGLGGNMPIFYTLQTGVTQQNYLVTGLTTGLIYSFFVEARNSEGYSGFS
jgi:hypothetical protein